METMHVLYPIKALSLGHHWLEAEGRVSLQLTTAWAVGEEGKEHGGRDIGGRRERGMDEIKYANGQQRAVMG